MVLEFQERETVTRLDYPKTKNLGEIKHNCLPGPSRALAVQSEYFLVLCCLKVSLLEEDLPARFLVCQNIVAPIVNT